MGVGGIIMVYFLIENDCVRGGRQTRGKIADLWGSMVGGVDIGTEWNLKNKSTPAVENITWVDIGTEWNLKVIQTSVACAGVAVDIGTEWNLKCQEKKKLKQRGLSRYRNRVEFKGSHMVGQGHLQLVDIGTEWNLKPPPWLFLSSSSICRYRNRVEFKATTASYLQADTFVDM